MSYFYLLSGAEEVRELAALELWALSGVEPDRCCGEGPVAVDVSGAAYTRFCARTLATGATLEELIAQTEALALAHEGFRIDVFYPSPAAPESMRVIATAVADSILGRPDLSHPRVRLVVVAQQGHWRLGELVSATVPDWRQWTPPVDFSAALPAQMSRALVNMVAAPGDVLLDPCCGAGTVVGQAARRGVRAIGVEISKKLAGRAAECLRGTTGALIIAGDGRLIGGRFDAAVVDFPYGRATTVAPDLYRDVLTNLRGLVQRAVVLTAAPLDDLLAETGFRVVRVAHARGGQLVRHVHLVAADGDDRPAVRRNSYRDTQRGGRPDSPSL
ncbi:MAG TPA: DNA methyltransferase [Armatimonadota bacterium]|jgi:hypothetical protein